MGTCLPVLSHGSCRQRLVQHLHIWMLGKVIEPAQVTNEFLQLLQKLQVPVQKGEAGKNKNSSTRAANGFASQTSLNMVRPQDSDSDSDSNKHTNKPDATNKFGRSATMMGASETNVF